MLFPFGTAKVGGEFGKKLEEEAFPRFFFQAGPGDARGACQEGRGGVRPGKTGKSMFFRKIKPRRFARDKKKPLLCTNLATVLCNNGI